MSPKLRIVIDTNVFISAALRPRSIPHTVVIEVFRHHVPLISRETFAEVEERFLQPKFDPYASRTERLHLLEMLFFASERVAVQTMISSFSIPMQGSRSRPREHSLNAWIRTHEAPMNPDEFENLSLDEFLAILPQGGYSFKTTSGEWIHGAVEQTWDGDPRDIDRDDVFIFLRRHLAFLKGERKPDEDGDDCVVIDD